MAQANIEASRRLIEEGFSEGRLELLDELCADGFVSHDPLAGDQDVEAVKQSITGYRDAFPDLTFTIDDIFDAGDKVVMRWTGVGTFQNEFMGLAPTGEKGDPVHGMSIDRYDDDGKLAESWGQWDTLALMRDIGAIPEAASAVTQS
jgi:predicted ester cyclase